ncbi:MAG TPA: hypothetical protein VFZ61_25745, partial [Polyangiales bacterium]
ALFAHRAALGRAGVVARRGAGRRAWALDWLVRRVGTVGVEALGGIHVVAEALAGASSMAPLEAAHELADSLRIERRAPT